MHKHFFVLLFAVLACLSSSAQLVQQQLPVPGPWSAVHDIAIDQQGNAVAAGYFLQSPDTQNLDILVKYTASGLVDWTAGTVSGAGLVANAVSVDPMGNIIVAGVINWVVNDTVQLEGGPVLVSLGAGPEIFIAKYTSAGSLLWAQTFPGGVWDEVTDLKCDANGNIFFTSKSYNGQLTIGGHTVPALSYYVAALSSSGAHLWVQSFNPEEVWVKEMSLDAAGNIYLTGYFVDFLEIGSVYQMGTQWACSFIVKLSNSGNPEWGRKASGYGQHVVGNGIATDADGNSVITGDFKGQITFITTTILGNTNNTSCFLAKYDSQGNLVWAKGFSGAGFVSGNSVAIDTDNKVLFTGYIVGTAQIGGFNLNSTTPFTPDLILCRLDSMGNVMSATDGGSAQWDLGKRVILDQNNNGYLLTSAASVLNPPNMPPYQPFSIGGFSDYVGQGESLFRFIAHNNANLVTGRIFFDSDLNGAYSAGDSTANDVLVEVNTAFAANSTHVGYAAYLGSGNASLAIPSPPLYHQVTPVSHAVNFSGLGNTDTIRHFALQPIPGQQDLRLTVTSVTEPMPGFNYQIQLSCKNVGTTILSGSVEAVLDPQLIVSATAPAFTTQTGSTLTWDFSNLQPHQTQNILITTMLPATAALGDTLGLSFLASPVAGDLTPANNAVPMEPVIVGSFDPNDKQVSYANLTPAEVASGKDLNYTIRFQNTGTAPAYTVRIIDTLDQQLNIPTFEVLSGSHPYTWSIRNGNIIEFRFDNIMLPDSNTNEPASHGFIKYRIKPKTTLALGDVIENTAYIYFDFNAPIVTNTATTEVKLVASVPTIERNSLHVYPNPSNGTFTLQCTDIWQQQVAAEMRNVLGQTVWQQNLATENGKLQQVISISNLPKGVYYLQVKTDRGSKLQKVVIE